MRKKGAYHTGEFKKRVRDMSSYLFVTLYTLFIYPSAHKQLRRHLSNPFRKVPCTILVHTLRYSFALLPCYIFIFNMTNFFVNENGETKLHQDSLGFSKTIIENKDFKLGCRNFPPFKVLNNTYICQKVKQKGRSSHASKNACTFVWASIICWVIHFWYTNETSVLSLLSIYINL